MVATLALASPSAFVIQNSSTLGAPEDGRNSVFLGLGPPEDGRNSNLRRLLCPKTNVILVYSGLGPPEDGRNSIL